MSQENIFQKNQFETWVGVAEDREDQKFNFKCAPYSEEAKFLYLDVLGEFVTHNRYYRIYRSIVEKANGE
jgi:hypothetical protein